MKNDVYGVDVFVKWNITDCDARQGAGEGADHDESGVRI
jgi:hypothetical protein